MTHIKDLEVHLRSGITEDQAMRAFAAAAKASLLNTDDFIEQYMIPSMINIVKQDAYRAVSNGLVFFLSELFLRAPAKIMQCIINVWKHLIKEKCVDEYPYTNCGKAMENILRKSTSEEGLYESIVKQLLNCFALLEQEEDILRTVTIFLAKLYLYIGKCVFTSSDSIDFCIRDI
jgi:hypothetical protein